MATRKNMRAYLFLTFLGMVSAFTVSYVPQAKGRKLFGGYRIVPKICQPTNPSRMKTDEPAICMFNHECTHRSGEVVGACVDGFLFGACCQLPSRQNGAGITDGGSNIDDLLSIHDIDHVPDIPILLNPDGSPVGMDLPTGNIKKPVFDTVNNEPSILDEINEGTRFPATRPSTPLYHYTDSLGNAERPQITPQADLTHLESDFPALLNQQSILDDLQLPGLLSHSDSNNDIQDHQDSAEINPVTTLLNSDQVLQIADPVDQLPALFAQGLGQNNHTSAETILLNEDGIVMNESNNPDELFKPGTMDQSKPTGQTSSQEPSYIPQENPSQTKISFTTLRDESLNQKPTFSPQRTSMHTTEVPSITLKIVSDSKRTPLLPENTTTTKKLHTSTQRIQYQTTTSPTEKTSAEVVHQKSTEAFSTMETRGTTPMSPLDDHKDGELVRVPTITFDSQSGNKKDDALNHEEMSISHILSILNDSTPNPPPQFLPESSAAPNNPDQDSGIQTWVSVDGTSLNPSMNEPDTSATTVSFPYTFYKPGQNSVYYDYGAAPTQPAENVNSNLVFSNSYTSRPSTHSSFDVTSPSHSSRPSTNPPAPTVIVLGPLETDYTTKATNLPPRRPPSTIRPITTKKPSISTTITHNISTVISTNNVEASNNHVVSTSYISVNLKDGTSMKPSTPEDVTTPQSFVFPGDSSPVIYEEILTKKPGVSEGTNTEKPPTKPSFHLKPATIRPVNDTFTWPYDNQRPVNPIIFKDPIYVNLDQYSTISPEEETTAPDDLNNFPPVRNPNLNMSIPASQQEKPTIVETFNYTVYPDTEILSENEIPTPAFIEDAVLTNKVDAFVNKIVQSLQGNFEDLKDVVYNKRNVSTASPTEATVTKKPSVVITTRKPIRRPTQATQNTAKPSQITTKRPISTKRPTLRLTTTTQRTVTTVRPTRPVKTTTPRPKPTNQYSATTKKPQTTTKRVKPTRKQTTTSTQSTQVFQDETESALVSSTEASTTIHGHVHTQNFKKECGVRPLIKTGRIVGGKGAQFGEWPWQVLVREATWLGLFTKNKCGGVLITSKYVVTAAHCQPGFLASLVAVFGEFDISGERESKRSVSRNVKRVIVNRGYDAATFENDLALLELETPVQFDTHIVPICMPEEKTDVIGRMATVTGWGRLKYNGGVPSVLQEVQVPIMENSVCQEMFQTAGHSKLILDSFLCAGYANGQKDSCEGDSGGPLMLQRPDGRWELVGTVSHGIKCAAPYLPGVYMRTTYFKPWLSSITGV